MILSKTGIFAAISAGLIKITPFRRSSVGACSVDLALSKNFRRFVRHTTPVRLSENLDYLAYTRPATATAAKPLEIMPGELVLGSTVERMRLSEGYCGWIQGRSRIARMGLSVHVSSSLIQPGVDNVQVLELVNNSPFPMLLAPGVRVCQVVFEEVRGRGKYSGVFAHQKRP